MFGFQDHRHAVVKLRAQLGLQYRFPCAGMVNCSPPPALARRGRTILFRRRPHRRREAWPPEVGFAVDSPLEEDPFELPVPPKTPGVLAVVLSRSRRLSLAEKPLPDLLGALRRFGIGAQPMSRPSGGIPATIPLTKQRGSDKFLTI